MSINNPSLDTLPDMAVFARVVEAGSFTRAADSLDMPNATLSKMVQDLEAHLGVRLLQRTTRRVTVTPEGREYYEKTLRIVRQNLLWAAGYNALSIPLAVMGWMPAWLAGLGMALSSLLVVLNAARLTRQLPVLHTSDAAAESAQRAVTAPAAPPLLGVR